MAIFPAYIVMGKKAMVDKELIKKAQTSDRAAMEILLKEITGFVWDFIDSHINNSADADDIAMEIIEEVAENLPKRSHIRDFDAWLSKIVWDHINVYGRDQERMLEIPMSSIFHRDRQPLSYDAIEELETIEAHINYGPAAAEELAEADAIFRGGWRERPRQKFLKHPDRKVIG